VTGSTAPASVIPSHVPAELVRDFDYDAFCHEGDDPFLAATRLHAEPPIIYGTRVFFGEPAWIPTRHAVIQEIFLHPEIFSSRRPPSAVQGLEEVNWRMIPFELDPPEHGKYRRILQPYFAPKSMRAMETMVGEICDSLMAPLLERDGCEFIGDFASKLPNIVFLKIMGLPVDMLGQFLAWEEAILRAPEDAQRAQASQELMVYLMGFCAEQRKDPQTELMKLIIGGKVDGEPLSDIDVLGTVFLLYLGGLDTVYSSLGWIFRHLANDQPLQQRLRDNPEDIPKAVEEFERCYAVTRQTRTVAHDCTFHGIEMREGEIVVLPIYLAGRDPATYENPEVVDIDRQVRYITFGTGPHTCLGIHLAKREIRIALESFLSHFRNIRIPEGETYEYHTGGVFGVDRLPLAWDRD